MIDYHRLGMLKGSSLDAFTITTTPQNIHSKQGLGNLFKCITLLDIKWYYLSEESQATLANLIASSSWQLNRKVRGLYGSKTMII